jgi:succinate dehydrogenase hydrophobic anchor subunit
MKQRSPAISAVLLLAYTWGGLFMLFVLGNIAVALVFGAAAEMNWPFSFLMVLLAPFVFAGGAIGAFVKYVHEQSHQKAGQSKAITEPPVSGC